MLIKYTLDRAKVVFFFLRLENNFTKQSHHDVHFTEVKNEAQSSEINLEDHSISGGTDTKACSPTSQSQENFPEPGRDTSKDETAVYYL